MKSRNNEPELAKKFKANGYLDTEDSAAKNGDLSFEEIEA